MVYHFFAILPQVYTPIVPHENITPKTPGTKQHPEKTQMYRRYWYCGLHYIQLTVPNNLIIIVYKIIMHNADVHY